MDHENERIIGKYIAEVGRNITQVLEQTGHLKKMRAKALIKTAQELGGKVTKERGRTIITMPK